jgi:group I intron endonuclease
MKCIYKIYNKITGQYYIGSTLNSKRRFRQHIVMLEKNKHPNKKLQNSFNKYSLDSFSFEILESFETISKELIIEKEQYYLDTLDLNKCFNLTFKAYGGGADVNSIECLILDLKGSVLGKCKSIKEFFNDYCGDNKYSSNKLNNGSIINKKYRIVTQDFYNNNFESVIKKWRSVYYYGLKK